MKWVNVKDYLPKERGEYLGYDTSCGGSVTIVLFTPKGKYNDSYFSAIAESDFMFETHYWMNMPEVPNK